MEFSAQIPPGLELFPIQQPPDGVVATFQPERVPSRAVIGIWVIYSFIAATLTVARVFTKLRIFRKFDWQDWAFLATYAMYAVWMGFVANALSPGLFHQWNVYLKDAEFYLLWYTLVGSLYEFTIAAIKVVIALELMRIFVTRRKGALYWSYVTLIVVSVVSGALCGFLEAFRCTPLRKAIHPLLLVNPQYGHCFDIDLARIFFSATLVVQDLALFALPQYSIWTLRMSQRKKIGVSIIFGFGIAGCIASSVRLYFTIRVKKEVDQLWNLVWLGLCLASEATCGIVVAASPVLPRLLKYLRDESPLRSYLKSAFASCSCTSESRTYVASPDNSANRRSKAISHQPVGSHGPVCAVHSSQQSQGPHYHHAPSQQKPGARHHGAWYEMLDNTQLSNESDDTAVSATEQARSGGCIAKTTEWTVEEVLVQNDGERGRKRHDVYDRPEGRPVKSYQPHHSHHLHPSHQSRPSMTSQQSQTTYYNSSFSNTPTTTLTSGNHNGHSRHSSGSSGISAIDEMDEIRPVPSIAISDRGNARSMSIPRKPVPAPQPSGWI